MPTCTAYMYIYAYICLYLYTYIHICLRIYSLHVCRYIYASIRLPTRQFLVCCRGGAQQRQGLQHPGQLRTGLGEDAKTGEVVTTASSTHRVQNTKKRERKTRKTKSVHKGGTIHGQFFVLCCFFLFSFFVFVFFVFFCFLFGCCFFLCLLF